MGAINSYGKLRRSSLKENEDKKTSPWKTDTTKRDAMKILGREG